MDPYRAGRRRARRAAAVVIAVAATAVGLTSAAESAPPAVAPVIELSASAAETTLTRVTVEGGWSYMEGDFGFWVDAPNAPFELRLRQRYGGPLHIDLVRQSATGSVNVRLPADLAAGFGGLEDFFSLRVRRADGTAVSSSQADFCPNGWDRSRINPSGPPMPVYPSSCSSSVWTVGQVMGIERGWSTPAFAGWQGPDQFQTLPDGRYQVEMWVRAPWRNALGLPWSAAKASIIINLASRTESGCGPECERQRQAATPGHGLADGGMNPLRTTSSEAARRSPSGAARAALDPNTLPDLASLPAWGIGTTTSIDSEGNPVDLLTFGATVWNAGPAPLVVEGFRRPTEDIMDSHQFFYRRGKPVASRPVGEMEYDPREGHNHWHFKDFAVYELASADTNVIQRSGKESWCLAPTDMVDLLRPGAEWRPGQTGLGTACGTQAARWIREVLPVGWGDTYTQYVAGQAFDITDLPNGKYLIKVTANPLKRLVEKTDANNVAFRKVIIGGTAGERTVKVPPYMGIDTEFRPFPGAARGHSHH